MQNLIQKGSKGLRPLEFSTVNEENEDDGVEEIKEGNKDGGVEEIKEENGDGWVSGTNRKPFRNG